MALGDLGTIIFGISTIASFIWVPLYLGEGSKKHKSTAKECIQVSKLLLAGIIIGFVLTFADPNTYWANKEYAYEILLAAPIAVLIDWFIGEVCKDRLKKLESK